MSGNLFIFHLFDSPIFFFRYLIILILSIVVHELAHGWAAISQGDDTPIRLGHMTPDPVVHMGVPSLLLACFMGMAWGQMPVTPQNFRHRWSDMWVSAAGPLSNFAIAIVSILLYVLSSHRGVGFISTEFFQLAARLNMLLFLFNMLPVPPLDGFTVFSELFPSMKPIRNSPVGTFMLVVMFTVPAIGMVLSLAAGGLVAAIEHTLILWANPFA
jgi:Zn-dependent protease